LFHLNASGPDGAWFCVEASADLTHWTPVATNQVVNGCIDFVDVGVPSGFQFFQAVPAAAGPSQ
jgi:hypothetical protein